MSRSSRIIVSTFLLALGFLLSARTASASSTSFGTLAAEPNCESLHNAKIQQYCLRDKILSSAPVTFFDLLKLVYPDLQPDGKASYAKKLRKSFAGFDDGQSIPEAPGEAPFAIENQDILLITAPGHSRLLVLNPRNGTLAYFQVEPTPKLLDLIGVSQDQNVDFASDFPVLEVRAGQFAFLTNSWHFNSAEAFNIYNLFVTAPERLDLVYDGPFLYSFTIPEKQDCRLEQQLKGLVALPTQHDGYSDLRMEVDEAKSCPKGEKQVFSAKRAYPLMLLWQASQGKYMGGSKELYQRNKCRQEEKPNCG